MVSKFDTRVEGETIYLAVSQARKGRILAIFGLAILGYYAFFVATLVLANWILTTFVFHNHHRPDWLFLSVLFIILAGIRLYKDLPEQRGRQVYEITHDGITYVNGHRTGGARGPVSQIMVDWSKDRLIKIVLGRHTGGPAILLDVVTPLESGVNAKKTMRTVSMVYDVADTDFVTGTIMSYLRNHLAVFEA